MRQEKIQKILQEYRVIAVVGLSGNKAKASYEVAAYMQQQGYQIVPVNPFETEILHQKSFKSLLDVPIEIQRNVGIVNIFRRSEDVPPIVEQAVKIKREIGTPHVIWMQLGIVNEKAAETAKEAGLTVIVDKCIMMEHKNLRLQRLT